ncbi:hypothetical protein AAHA92_21921 [Salvia divinorum]|uniref:Uncharacterized protein n=1 Tax=Salvia divinorum TaxID=28513 RepID=A0ABD1GM03_SALDI
MHEMNLIKEAFPYYGPPAEMEYPAQVYAARSWNANGSWNPGKQRDAPWRDHPNFRWSDADQNQPAPQAQNFQNRVEGPSGWSSRNPERTNKWGNRNQGGNSNWSSGNQPNWSGRNQQGTPADSYVPPHQRGFSGYGTNGSFHPQQGQRYNNYSNQQGNPHFNQGPGYSRHASGSGQPYHKQQQKPTDDLVGDLLNTQQHLHNDIQANNDVVHKLQDAQMEQKAAMDMLARQLSQIATSVSEMRGNEGRIPATVKMPRKENVSLITLQPDGNQERPIMQIGDGELLGGGSDDQLIKEMEQAEDNLELRRKELESPLPQVADQIFLDPEEEVASKEDKQEGEKTEEKKEAAIAIEEDVSGVIQRKRIPSKQSDPGMFTLPISIGNIEITHVMCDLRASINVLPLSVYQKLSGAKMVDARVVIQLADCSCIRPEGVLENMIVKVHGFIYPMDFYVIKTAGSESAGSSGVLLGRPFLKTAKTIINVFDGTLCLDYYGEKYTLSIKEATKKPTDMEDLHSVEDIAPPVYEYSMEELLQEGYVEVEGNNEIEREVVKWNQEVQTQGITDQKIDEVIMNFCLGSQAAWSSGPIQLQKEEDDKDGKRQ